MNKMVALSVMMLLLVGCASTSMPDKDFMIVSAVPKSADDTGWYRDYCTNGLPFNDAVVPYGDSCGENKSLHLANLFKVMLSDVRTLEGELISDEIYAAMPAEHYFFWNKRYKAPRYFILHKAPREFAEDVDVSYLMSAPLSYDEELGCIGSFGNYAHTDLRDCPDKQFHHGGHHDCTPIEEVLEHFAEG